MNITCCQVWGKNVLYIESECVLTHTYPQECVLVSKLLFANESTPRMNRIIQESTHSNEGFKKKKKLKQDQ